jgi:hypothetical protein
MRHFVGKPSTPGPAAHFVFGGVLDRCSCWELILLPPAGAAAVGGNEASACSGRRSIYSSGRAPARITQRFLGAHRVGIGPITSKGPSLPLRAHRPNYDPDAPGVILMKCQGPSKDQVPSAENDIFS